MKELSRLLLPNPWIVDSLRTGDPFATPQELRRREENRIRVEEARDRRTHGFGDFRFRSGVAKIRR